MKRIVLFMLLALCAGLASAQQAGTASLKERMSPEQFKAAGLNKLSDSGGFLGLDGPFRFNNTGMLERALEVREVRAGGVTIVSPAPAKFQD